MSRRNAAAATGRVRGGARGRAKRTPNEVVRDARRFPVIGVAASGADPAPVFELLEGLGPQPFVATVIVPCDDTPLPQPLVRRLNVALDGQRLEPGQVYLLPSREALRLEGTVLRAAKGSGPSGFFTSLADLGELAFAVLLSCASAGPLPGVRALKSKGGTVAVQEPATARIDALPRAAAAAGLADHVASVHLLVEHLMRRVLRLRAAEGAIEGASPGAGDAAWSELDVRRLFALMKLHFNVDLSGYKPAPLRRRVERRMAVDGIRTLARFVEHLSGNAVAREALHDELFIHVTQFFRDPDAFVALCENALARVVRDCPPEGHVRVWVPGCSTGEEPYSLCIAFVEVAEKLGLPLRLQLFGTDISDSAVRQARSAVYAANALEGLGPSRLQRFFEPCDSGFRVKKSVRERCVFARHDLTRDPPIAHVDLISCRNVLIYFDAGLQGLVMPVLHYALKPAGFLWLGSAETPGGLSRLFTTVDSAHKLYAKVDAPVLASALAEAALRPSLGLLTERRLAEGGSPLHRSADEVVLFRYGPPSVVVDAGLDVVQFRGNTKAYLAPASGVGPQGLLALAHAQLRPALERLAQTVTKRNQAGRTDGVRATTGGVRRRVAIEMTPLNPIDAPRDRQYLVAFEGAPEVRARGKGRSAGGHSRVAQLENELGTLRESQQSLAGQFELAQEELSSANEELQSANEELKSTNEELEATMVELQAANQELITLNHELHSRNAELVTTNEKLARGEDRFRIMVESVKDYALYMLDPSGYVTSWNEGARRLKGYEASEIVGQSFARFFTPEDVAASVPEEELNKARAGGRCDVEGWRLRKDGTRFWASVVVARMNDIDGKLIGFAKVTRDLTEHRRVQEALRAANERLEARVVDRTQELQTALKVRDEFLSIASHELKTPLTGLKLQLQLGRRGVKTGRHGGPSDVLDALERSLRQALNLEELVEDLLDVSRIQTGRVVLDLHPLDVAEVVDEVVARFAPQFEHAKTPLEVELERSGVARCDRRRLGQVLSNLLANALKYAPKKPVRVSMAPAPSGVRISVKDHGRGIAPEKQAVIFDRFERADASPGIGGLGLGLFISRRIVEAHGGTLRVESAPGEGACFIVELPQEVRPS
jgi:two-component system CheB/CheR fusion protein